MLISTDLCSSPQVRSAILTAAQCATYDEVKRGVVASTGWSDKFVGTHLMSSMIAGEMHYLMHWVYTGGSVPNCTRVHMGMMMKKWICPVRRLWQFCDRHMQS